MNCNILAAAGQAGSLLDETALGDPEGLLMEARSPHWRAAVLPVELVAAVVALMIATWV